MRAEGAARSVEPGGAARRPAMSTNVWWTLLGTAANSAGTWLVIVILARSSGAAAVGTYAMALALTAPVMAFTENLTRWLLVLVILVIIL